MTDLQRDNLELASKEAAKILIEFKEGSLKKQQPMQGVDCWKCEEGVEHKHETT